MTNKLPPLLPPTGISVVIPTMNRAEVLLDTLRDLQAQTFRDFEVIVIDQSDAPNEEAEALLSNFGVPARYAFVTHFRGLPEARNFGWRMAAKDIVVYIDDDIRCGPKFLQAHHDAHIQSGATLIAGGITEAKGDTTKAGRTGSFNWWTATSTRNFHLEKERWCLHAPGGNFSVSRDALEQVGGFDENLTVGAALYEETDFALRLRAAGHSAWFAPAAHIVHLAAPMGGCRVTKGWPEYMFGMAHNRSILIFRHLRPYHRPSALFRLFLFGISYSRLMGTPAPLWATFRGVRAGRKAAGVPKVAPPTSDPAARETALSGKSDARGGHASSVAPVACKPE